MGWASGSQLAEEVWDVVRPLIPAAKRKKAALSIIDSFESYDCDTLDEAETLMKDAGRQNEDESEW
jgi:hypothetical protein